MKASLYDVLFFPVIVVSVLISLLIAGVLIGAIIEKGSEMFTPEGVHALNKSKEAVDLLTNSVVFVVFVLMFTAVALAYFTPAYPIFFPLSTIIGAFGVVLAWLFSNVLNEFAKAAPPTTETAAAVSFIIGNLPILTLIMWLFIVIVAYGRLREIERPGVL